MVCIYTWLRYYFPLNSQNSVKAGKQKKSTVQNTTSMIVQNTCRSHKEKDTSSKSLFVTEDFRFVKCALQVIKISLNKLNIGWNFSDFVQWSDVTVAWQPVAWLCVEWSSHAVDHVAGALSDVSDLADVRRTDGDSSSSTAVRHWAHQLPSEPGTQVNRQLTTRTLWTSRGHFKIPFFRKLLKSFKC